MDTKECQLRINYIFQNWHYSDLKFKLLECNILFALLY